MAPSMSVTRSVAIVGGLARQALFRRPSFRSTPWPADSSLASSGPRFILTCPLGVRQAPPTTERLVELHVGEETVAANLRERVLRRVELLLGFEHFEIIGQPLRSEEHTSELQSPCNLVCRLLLEKKKNKP